METTISRSADGPDVRMLPPDARGPKDDSPRKRIMVLPFLDADSEHSGMATKIARDTLINELNKSGDYVIVGASDFPRKITDFIKDGVYDLPAMAKIASDAGIAALLEGKLIEITANRAGDSVGFVRNVNVVVTAKIQTRLIATKNAQILLEDVRNARIEQASTRVGEHASSDRQLTENPLLVEKVVKRAFADSVPKIELAAQKLSWEGRVALIKGDRLYLNSGRLSGLQIGDILKVMEDGEDVYDPESGALIGRVPGRLKGTLEIVSYFGKDGAISVIHSGAGFKENDVVQLY